MPCPPDPVEYEYSQRYRGRSEWVKKIRSLQVKICEVRQLIRTFLAKFEGLIDDPEVIRMVESELNAGFPDCSRPEEIRHPYEEPRTWPDAGDLAKLESNLSSLVVEHRQLEKALCISRDILVKLFRSTGTQLEQLGASLQASVRQEFEDHLSHRREDREHMVKYLLSLQNRLRMGEKPEFLKDFPDIDTPDKIDTRIEWLRRLTDEELLSDRNLF